LTGSKLAVSSVTPNDPTEPFFYGQVRIADTEIVYPNPLKSQDTAWTNLEDTAGYSNFRDSVETFSMPFVEN